MSTVSAEQLTEIVEHIGNQFHLPQVVQHFDKSNVYSTDERIVGQYIDGKLVYQKTINCGAGPNLAIKKVDASNLSIDSMVYMTGMAHWTSPDSFAPIPYVHDSASLGIGFNYSDGYIQIFNRNTDYSAWTFIVTIQYTKTTDTALDYTIGTENDYSTEERLIGTWVDGSGVYQKTVYLGALPNNTSKDVAHNISDSFRLISAFGAAYRSSDGANIPLPMVDMSLANMVRINITQSKITVVTGSDRSTWTGYVTIQYIKTA